VVDRRFFDQNVGPLAERFHVFTPDLRGHGHTADVEGPLTYEKLAQDTIEFLEAVIDGPAHLAGHSVGAGVALVVALRRPDLVRRLILISGAFHHDGLITADEIDVDQVVEGFGASYRGIPNSELALVPGTSHFLVQEKPSLCNTIILEFLTTDAVPTIAPIRRSN
jgi:pimeloyl-ACP methyl ester carboxylesterase